MNSLEITKAKDLNLPAPKRTKVTKKVVAKKPVVVAKGSKIPADALTARHAAQQRSVNQNQRRSGL